MDREKFIAGLRELADFFEAHPGVPAGDYPIEVSSFQFPDWRVEDGVEREAELKLRMGQIARSYGGCQKRQTASGYFILERTLPSGAKVSTYTQRELVCEKKVVGKKITPGRIVPAREEEICEWDCHPSILAA